MSFAMMPDEVKIAEVRQHWVILVPGIGTLVIGWLVLVIFLNWLPSRILSLEISGVRSAIELLTLLAIAIFALVKYLAWHFTTYTLTDRRIVLTRGVLSKLTESIALDRVQDTIMRRPLLDRMIGASDVEIESAGRDGAEVLRRIPQGENFYNQLLEAIERHRLGAAPPAPPSGAVVHDGGGL